MSRTDYYDDPHAPAANSIVAAASAVVVDNAGRILLHRRRDNEMWALPGGAMTIGETITDTVLREVLEETGLQVEIDRLIGIYTDPKHVFAYSDGEVRQEFSICFACRVRGGALQASDESYEVRLFDPPDIEGLSMHPRIRLRITDYLQDAAAPFLR